MTSLPLERLAEHLSAAEDATEAVRLVLRDLLEASGSDGGAVLLAEPEGFRVAIAESKKGKPLEGAEQILSHTVVHEVLRTGKRLYVFDATRETQWASESVILLRLRSLLCVPMLVGARVVGAIFLGTRTPGGLNEGLGGEVQLVASMLVPLLAQLRKLEQARAKHPVESLLLGESDAMVEVRTLVRRVAASDLSVLVLGETGTGKELVARAIHEGSPREARPLVALNCAAVPEGLLASELFGAKRGAFTGAVADRRGKLELAHESTLFLDEIGDMPLSMQAALLRALEERSVTRLGDNAAVPADFRLVAATHRDLDEAIEAGRFRQDLFFRLCEVTIRLPRLADRGEDVLLLAHAFITQAASQLRLPARALTPAARDRLMRHDWPGNVRELRATMRRAAVLCEGDTIDVAHLVLERAPKPRASQPAAVDFERTLEEARDEFTTFYVREVVNRHAGNREAAAAALGISLRSLYRYLSNA